MSSPATATSWLPTPKAAEALGCSPKHLRAQHDICGGFLDATVHWAYGPTLNSAITWNVELVREAFHRRGVCVRRINQVDPSKVAQHFLTTAAMEEGYAPKDC